MTFDIKPLPQSFQFSDAKTSPYIVEGKGQKVYWRNCWIKVYDKGHSEPREQHEKCDGWAIVLADTEVTFGGQGGSVVEK
ncbi:hypothetical protein BS50DRAFT_579828 [Corynespora cassiicola Philippines]|uniref:Uncharacterized protein n=1 Tax=Corynespora cassiicola Philippines TaxID=1448308 RepID=A0A2T2N2W0_CORCC|nr:hypothetical protein BS50DRAFT_579828 [Corynespora cassiicola Philippines]